MKRTFRFLNIFVWVLSTVIILMSAVYLFAQRSYTLNRASSIESSGLDVKKVLSVLALTLDGLVSATRGINQYPVPMLMYHYVREVDEADDPLGYKLSVSPQLFKTHLEGFQSAGFNTITLEEFLQGKFDRDAIILTFDDGYLDFYTQAYPLLKRYQFGATVFVVSGFTDQRIDQHLSSWQIKELVAGGIEIGSHSIDHVNLTSLDEERLKLQLSESRLALEELIGKPVVALAYPSGQYNDQVIAAAKKIGYLVGVTTEPGVASLESNLLKLPRLRVGGNETVDSLIERIRKLKADGGS